MGKRLGQYFLVNRGIIEKIIEGLDLKPGDTIIEIGPGRGALTLPLMKKCQAVGCRILAIEKDPSLAKNLESRIKNLELNNLEILVADVLKALPSLIHDSRFKIQDYKIVGNIPYYITGRLLRILSELPDKPKLIVLTIQKEVAERIVSQPPRMNLLAAITQFWSEPEIIGRLGPKDFSPPSKVDSATIKLKIKDRRSKIENKEYYRFIKILFKQPRKTVFNNLRAGLNADNQKILALLNRLELTGEKRPGDLGLKQMIDLSQVYLKDL